MKVSKHEQQLIDYINGKMFPLYAEYDKAFGVVIYPSAGKRFTDHIWGSFDSWLLIVSDSDTSMAAIFYYNFNENQAQDVPLKLWERLYAKLKEFVRENADYAMTIDAMKEEVKDDE